jgi:hypothetical protein
MRGCRLFEYKLFSRTGILCKRMKVAAFKNGIPDRGWWGSMKKRNPALSIKKPEKFGISSAHAQPHRCRQIHGG